MDYEKAYKEALERALAGKPMNEVFPELHEGEDERIRKWISDRLLANYSKEDDRVKEALVWLDKQKAQKPIQTENEREYVRTLKSLISDFIRGKDEVDTAYYQKIYDWLDGRHIEQQPAETSNIDLDTKVNDWIGYMLNDNAQSYSRKNVQIMLDNCARFFYDYAVMCLDKPAEWSEEDEKCCKIALLAINDHPLKQDELKAFNWLRALKSRFGWKPSAEQMDALDEYIWAKEPNKDKAKYVISLYRDLKKL